MESQWSEKCDDPRIAPHLQTLADMSFASLVKIANSMGIGAINAPFVFMDSDVGNTWKACIAEFLAALLPPDESLAQKQESRQQEAGGGGEVV